MTLPARAAAVRGDDYQYAIAWNYAVAALRDEDVLSVSVEDKGAGHFDDVVVRRRTRPSEFRQVKSSNYGNVVVGEMWLTTPVSAKGASPLAHFFATWRDLVTARDPCVLEFMTNRGFPPDDPLLGEPRDLSTGKVDVGLLRTKSERTNAGKALKRWANHLQAATDDVLAFLTDVAWLQVQSETAWREQAKPLMELAGLRTDDGAVTAGINIVRTWVKTGAGPQTPEQIQEQCVAAELLATTGTITLAVTAIDRPQHPSRPHVTVDLLDLYDGDDASSRYHLRDGIEWNRDALPLLREGAHRLESGFATRQVHVTGAMRLPVYFTVGCLLPDVRGWTLQVTQRGMQWSTAATPETGVAAATLAEHSLGLGSDLAVVIALTHACRVDEDDDVGAEIRDFAVSEKLPVTNVLVLGPSGGPGQSSVPSDEWLIAWVRSARERARAAARAVGASRIHLFFAAPAAGALMLGHVWNVMPTTVVYDYDRVSYQPTFTLG